jgi:hypothetical protein
MFECSCKCASLIFFIIWSVAVILISILVAFSFSTIEINQGGLKFDNVNFQLEQNAIYLPGRHWIGLGKEFKTYPLDYQYIDFTPGKLGPVTAKTSDPLQIFLDVEVTYKLRAEFLLSLNTLYPKMDHHYHFSNLVKAEILNTAEKYSLSDFFRKRQIICEQMSNSINLAFRTVFAELEFFSLKEISFDDSIEKVLVENMVIINKEKSTSGIIEVNEGYIDNLKYTTLSNITEMMTEMYKNSNISLAQAEYILLSKQIESSSENLKNFISIYGLNFTTSELNKLLMYLQIDENNFFEKVDIESIEGKKNDEEENFMNDVIIGIDRIHIKE